jgi:hypothetical protein
LFHRYLKREFLLILTLIILCTLSSFECSLEQKVLPNETEGFLKILFDSEASPNCSNFLPPYGLTPHQWYLLEQAEAAIDLDVERLEGCRSNKSTPRDAVLSENRPSIGNLSEKERLRNIHRDEQDVRVIRGVNPNVQMKRESPHGERASRKAASYKTKQIEKRGQSSTATRHNTLG